MNRIYSRVWNASQQQWVVASEFATGDSLAAPRVVDRRCALPAALGALAVSMLLSLGDIAPAFAADAVCVNPVGGAPVGDASAAGDQVACGQGAVASGPEAIAIGSRARASGNSAVAMGADALATTSSAVAVGDEAQATGLTSTAVGYRTRAQGAYSVAFGSGAQALGDVAYALGNNAQARAYDVAIGAGALTNSTGSTQTTSIGYNSGFESTDTAESVFIGATTGNNSVGRQNTYLGFGTGAEANGHRNVYSGYYSGAGSSGSFNVASGNYAFAASSGSNNVTQGAAAGALVSGSNNVAIGYRAGTQVSLNAGGEVTAVVASAYSNAVNIGSNTQAFADGAVALGAGAQSSHAGSVALGENSIADGSTLASSAYSPTGDINDVMGIAPVGEVSVGSAGNERRITNVAAGSAATDAVNVSQLQAAQTHYYSVNDNGAVAGNYNNDGALGTNSLAAGVDAATTAAATNATAIGTASQVGAVGGTALGFSSSATGAYSISVGDSVASAGNSIAVGRNAAASAANATAIGGADAATDAARAQAARSTALGWGSTAAGVGSISVGDSNASTQNAIAIGTGAAATGTGSIEGAVAIGYNARATQYLSLAIGTRSTASNRWAIAVGDMATASGSDSLAVGSSAAASAVASTALGVLATASEESAIAIGGGARATGQQSVAIGGGDYATNSMSDGASASGTRAISIGYRAASVADDSLAIGGSAATTGASSIAIGRETRATVEGAVALGAGAQSSHAGSVALGESSVADGSTLAGSAYSPTGDISDVMGVAPVGEVSVGSAGNERRITNVAAGSASTDAVNVSQLQAVQARYYSVNDNGTVGGNYNNNGATGVNALAAGVAARASEQADLAVGFDSQASGSNSIAVGTSSRATDEHATAIGYTATANGASGIAIGFVAQAAGAGNIAIGHGATTSTASEALAIGVSATANGERSLALGADNVVDGARSGAVGVGSTVEGNDSYSLGNNNTLGVAASNSFAVGNDIEIQVASATALGHGASVTQAGGVALGSQSVADTAAGIAGYVPVGAGTAQADAINATTSTLAAVSVGSAGNTRQITNVAAGTNDTDAVNVSQLEAVADIANAGWNVADGDGNAANIGPNGTVTFQGDANLTVTQTGVNDDGVVEIALNRDLDVDSVTAGDTIIDSSGVAIGADVVLNSTGLVINGGPSMTTAGINAGDTVITNVAPGVAPTDAVNVSQLTAVETIANAGWNVADGGGNAANIGPNGTVTFQGDANLTVTQTGLDDDGVVEIALNRDLDVDSVTAGDTLIDNSGVAIGADVVLNSTGLVINGGPSVTIAGINAGDTVITNVAPGVAPTDAVNVSQLTAVETIANTGWNVADGGGNAANIGPNGTVTFQGDANLTVAQTGAEDDGVLEIALNRDIDVDSVTAGDSVLDNSGLTVDDGAGNVSTVSAGTVSVTDAAGTTAIGGNAITVGGASPIVISGATGTIGGLTNLTWDPDSYTSGQAATEDQLALVSSAANAGWNVSDAAGNAANIGPNGTVTFQGDANLTVTQTGVNDDGVVEIALNRDLDVDSITAGDTIIDNSGVAIGADVVLNGTGLVINGGPSMTTAGINAGDTVITNVAPGVAPTDAVNVSQLTAVEAIANAGWNVADGDGNAANIGPNGAVTFESGNANIAVSQTGVDDDGVVDITLSNNLDLTEAGSLSIGDTVVSNAGVAVGVNVALGNAGLTVVGATTTTVVNGNGLTSGTVGLSGVTNDVTGLSNLDLTAADFATAGRAATEEQLQLVQNQIGGAIGNLTHYYSVNDNNVVGGNYTNDGATGLNAVAIGVNSVTTGDHGFAAGSFAQSLAAGSIAVGHGAISDAGSANALVLGTSARAAAAENAVVLGNAASVTALDSVAIGNGATASHANSIALGAGSATTIGAQASYEGAYVGTSSSTGEMNIGGRQLTGVAAGSAPTDAVNVSQLQGGVNHAITTANAYTDTQIANLDSRVTSIEGDLIDIRGDITDIQGDIVDIRGDITDLGGRVTSVEGDVATLANTVNQFDNRINAVQNGADGMFQISQEGPIVKPTPTGTNASAGGNGAVASGNNSTAVGNQSVASGNNSTAIGQGAVATHDNSVALGQGSATTVGAQTGYNAAYVGSSNSTGEVNMGGRTITGIAPGIAGTDAVNVSQLNAGVNYAVAQANQYTDDRFNQFQNDIWLSNDELRRDMNAAVASALAVKQAPWIAGKTTYYAGVAAYRDQGAVGLSLRRTADNGRWSLEGGFTQNRDGSGVYVGVSGVIGD